MGGEGVEGGSGGMGGKCALLYRRLLRIKETTFAVLRVGGGNASRLGTSSETAANAAGVNDR